ncbi:MAG: NnrU family protein [Polaromonas sp.]|uniref:NnrU family protein n=2 Tax=Polaromonas sp. TaxID=1869339 RepID=UPI002716593B|nr:NnrU family protein [Polaromonas sp.]MDO9115626.1 NnrU family protein [Polaromonas sp.]MDP1885459.1 NnrU family protein [Polaromonas sp.]MDP2448712.1 NnrU family protein [Polaromonas sp.]MDP3248646.1 NnrU family protein [Polaromonas sp.]MDP3825730.1 NnrU family protein [Polaromonas sp.]
MAILILGLVLFLGVHSIRIVADGWRTATIGRVGELPWKAVYALLSIVGFVLIVWGFGLARQQPVQLWLAPRGMRHLASLLTLISFVLVAAAYVPRNAIKARLHHPMVLGVKVWALAHLLANGNLAHVVLFGTFLLWAALSFRAARARDRAAGTVYPAGTASGTGITVVVGVAAWALFAFWAHGYLIGIRPIG